MPGPVTAANARFNTPMGIAVDGTGTVLYVADTGNQVIRRINLNNGEVTTIAGVQGSAGTLATQFNSPPRAGAVRQFALCGGPE